MKLSHAVATACLFVALTPIAQSQNIVQNGGFELGNFNDWVVHNINSTIVAETGVAAPPGIAHTGSYYANFGDFVNNQGSILQTLTTVAGQEYTLDYFVGNYGAGGLATPNELSVSIAGTTVSDLINLPTQNYKEYTDTFVASGSSTDLKFMGGDNPYALFLDDVSVTEVASTPEPTAYQMSALLVMGGIGLLYLRKKRAAADANA